MTFSRFNCAYGLPSKFQCETAIGYKTTEWSKVINVSIIDFRWHYFSPTWREKQKKCLSQKEYWFSVLLECFYRFSIEFSFVYARTHNKMNVNRRTSAKVSFSQRNNSPMNHRLCMMNDISRNLLAFGHRHLITSLARNLRYNFRIVLFKIWCPLGICLANKDSSFYDKKIVGSDVDLFSIHMRPLWCKWPIAQYEGK